MATKSTFSSLGAGFNIPKQRNTDLLNRKNVAERESVDLLKEVDQTCLDPIHVIRKQWVVSSIYKIRPSNFVENRYKEKRVKLKEQGGNRNPQEILGFFICKDKKEAVTLARTGIKICSNVYNQLGDPKQGIYLFRYLDVALLSQMETERAYVLVLKVLTGRIKQIPIYLFGGPSKDPTPNYDAHMSQSAPTVDESRSVIIHKSQMYLYEYTDESVPASYPPQCLPYALIEFDICRKNSISTVPVGSAAISMSAAKSGWSRGHKLLPDPCRPSPNNPSGIPMPPMTPKDISPSMDSGFMKPNELSTPNHPAFLRGVGVPNSRNVSLALDASILFGITTSAPNIDELSQAASVGPLRDPRLRRSVCDTEVRSADLDIFEANNTGYHETNNSNAIKNLMTTVKRLWPSGSDRDSSIPIYTGTCTDEGSDHREWGLTWNSTFDDVDSQQAIMQPDGSQWLAPGAAPKRFDPRLKDPKHGAKISDPNFFQCSNTESSKLLSETDLASLFEGQTGMKRPPPPSNSAPKKSVLKKTSELSYSSTDVDGKKKKLSLQDYKKKKTEESVRGQQPTTLPVPVSARTDESETTNQSFSRTKPADAFQSFTLVVPNASTDHEFVGTHKTLTTTVTEMTQRVYGKVSDSRDYQSAASSLSADHQSVMDKETVSNLNTIERTDPVSIVTEQTVSSSVQSQETKLMPDHKSVKDKETVSNLEKTELIDPVSTVTAQAVSSLNQSQETKFVPDHKSVKDKQTVSNLNKIEQTDLTSTFIKQISSTNESDETKLVPVVSGTVSDQQQAGPSPTKSQRFSNMCAHLFTDRSIQQATCLSENSDSIAKPVDSNYSVYVKNEQNDKEIDRSHHNILFDDIGDEDNDEHLLTVSLDDQEEEAKGTEVCLPTLPVVKSPSKKPKAITTETTPHLQSPPSQLLVGGSPGIQTQANGDDSIRSRNHSPCSDPSPKRSRGNSPCSDISGRSVRSVECSSVQNLYSDDSNCATAGQTNNTIENKGKGKNKRRPNSKQKTTNTEYEALLRLSLGLRPGKVIQVGGLGKNPTDDPLPILGDEKRKKQSAGGRKKKRTKAQKGKDKEKDDVEIDYTDFQFEEPQEFCVSICDELDTSSVPENTEVHEEKTSTDIFGQALPLSFLGFSHWTEALVAPQLDPQVTLVDLFKVYQSMETKVDGGQTDFDNCAICRKVIDTALLEGDFDEQHTVQTSEATLPQTSVTVIKTEPDIEEDMFVSLHKEPNEVGDGHVATEILPSQKTSPARVRLELTVTDKEFHVSEMQSLDLDASRPNEAEEFSSSQESKLNTTLDINQVEQDISVLSESGCDKVYGCVAESRQESGPSDSRHDKVDAQPDKSIKVGAVKHVARAPQIKCNYASESREITTSSESEKNNIGSVADNILEISAPNVQKNNMPALESSAILESRQKGVDAPIDSIAKVCLQKADERTLSKQDNSVAQISAKDMLSHHSETMPADCNKEFLSQKDEHSTSIVQTCKMQTPDNRNLSNRIVSEEQGKNEKGRKIQNMSKTDTITKDIFTLYAGNESSSLSCTICLDNSQQNEVSACGSDSDLLVRKRAKPSLVSEKWKNWLHTQGKSSNESENSPIRPGKHFTTEYESNHNSQGQYLSERHENDLDISDRELMSKSIEKSGISDVVSNPWEESGFWLGISELKRLQQLPGHVDSDVDNEDIISQSVTKISPIKLARLVPDPEYLTSVKMHTEPPRFGSNPSEILNTAICTEQSENQPIHLNSSATCSKLGEILNTDKGTDPSEYQPIQLNTSATRLQLGEILNTDIGTEQNENQLIQLNSSATRSKLGEILNTDIGTEQSQNQPIQMYSSATQSKFLDEFAQMFKQATGVEVVRKTVIPGLDFIQQNEQQEFATVAQDPSNSEVTPDITPDTEAIRKILKTAKALTKNQLHSEAPGVEHMNLTETLNKDDEMEILKTADDVVSVLPPTDKRSAEEEQTEKKVEEAPQTETLNKSVMHTEEDLDVSGTHGPLSRNWDILKRPVSFNCKALNIKPQRSPKAANPENKETDINTKTPETSKRNEQEPIDLTSDLSVSINGLADTDIVSAAGKSFFPDAANVMNAISTVLTDSAGKISTDTSRKLDTCKVNKNINKSKWDQKQSSSVLKNSNVEPAAPVTTEASNVCPCIPNDDTVDNEHSAIYSTGYDIAGHENTHYNPFSIEYATGRPLWSGPSVHVPPPPVPFPNQNLALVIPTAPLHMGTIQPCLSVPPPMLNQTGGIGCVGSTFPMFSQQSISFPSLGVGLYSGVPPPVTISMHQPPPPGTSTLESANTTGGFNVQSFPVSSEQHIINSSQQSISTLSAQIKELQTASVVDHRPSVSSVTNTSVPSHSKDSLDSTIPSQNSSKPDVLKWFGERAAKDKTDVFECFRDIFDRNRKRSAVYFEKEPQPKRSYRGNSAEQPRNRYRDDSSDQDRSSDDDNSPGQRRHRDVTPERNRRDSPYQGRGRDASSDRNRFRNDSPERKKFRDCSPERHKFRDDLTYLRRHTDDSPKQGRFREDLDQTRSIQKEDSPSQTNSRIRDGSQGQKRNRFQNSAEKSDKGSYYDSKRSRCESGEKRMSPEPGNKRSNSCESDTRCGKKQKTKDKISFKVAVTDAASTLRKCVNLESDSESESNHVSAELTESKSKRAHEIDKRSGETSVGKVSRITGGSPTKDKTRCLVAQSKYSRTKIARDSKAVSLGRSKSLDDRQTPVGDPEIPTSTIRKSRWDNKVLESRQSDPDDDMNAYAHNLLEGAVNTNLAVISNNVSTSIQKSLSVFHKVDVKNCESQKSVDVKLKQTEPSLESVPKSKKTNLLDKKPLEYLLFAKEMIVKKLQEENEIEKNKQEVTQDQNKTTVQSSKYSESSCKNTRSKEHEDRPNPAAVSLSQDEPKRNSVQISKAPQITEEEIKLFTKIICESAAPQLTTKETPAELHEVSGDKKDFDTTHKKPTPTPVRKPNLAGQDWSILLDKSRSNLQSCNLRETSPKVYDDLLASVTLLDSKDSLSTEVSTPSDTTKTSLSASTLMQSVTDSILNSPSVNVTPVEVPSVSSKHLSIDAPLDQPRAATVLKQHSEVIAATEHSPTVTLPKESSIVPPVDTKKICAKADNSLKQKLTTAVQTKSNLSSMPKEKQMSVDLIQLEADDSTQKHIPGTIQKPVLLSTPPKSIPTVLNKTIVSGCTTQNKQVLADSRQKSDVLVLSVTKTLSNKQPAVVTTQVITKATYSLSSVSKSHTPELQVPSLQPQLVFSSVASSTSQLTSVAQTVPQNSSGQSTMLSANAHSRVNNVTDTVTKCQEPSPQPLIQSVSSSQGGSFTPCALTNSPQNAASVVSVSINGSTQNVAQTLSGQSTWSNSSSTQKETTLVRELHKAPQSKTETVQLWLSANFPGVDIKSLNTCLFKNITMSTDLAMLSNKTKKNLLFSVHKYLNKFTPRATVVSQSSGNSSTENAHPSNLIDLAAVTSHSNICSKSASANGAESVARLSIQTSSINTANKAECSALPLSRMGAKMLPTTAAPSESCSKATAHGAKQITQAPKNSASTTASPSTSATVTASHDPSQLIARVGMCLDRFAAEQIDLEYRLIDGCLKLLLATQESQSLIGVAQDGPGVQPFIRSSSTVDSMHVIKAFEFVINDMKNALEDTRCQFHGRPNQRVPNELLLTEELNSLYNKAGIYLILQKAICNKPYTKLKKLKMDIQTSLNKCAVLVRENNSFALQQERRRVLALRTERNPILTTFTGACNIQRLRKLQVSRDCYRACQNHIVTVLGQENVNKMVFFKATFDTITLHANIVEDEMMKT